LQALQWAQHTRKVLAAARVVAHAAPVVGPEAALVVARALVPALAAQVPAVLEMAVEEPAQADPVAAASRMSSGADKAPPVLPACATRRPRHPTAPCRAANGSRFAIF
jgi:hypothetical protein